VNPRLPGEKIFIGAASSSHSLSSTSPARRAARTPRRATMAATIVSSVSLTARPRAATRELRARAAPAKATRVVALRASSEKARPPRRRLHHLHIISITFRVASRFRPRAPAALRRHASTRRLPTDLDSALPYIESDPRQVEATTSRREVAVKALAALTAAAAIRPAPVRPRERDTTIDRAVARVEP